MSTDSVPFNLPVQISSQNAEISFTQNEGGYFMNFDLRVQIPLKDLVDSLVSCGDVGRDAIAGIAAPLVRKEIFSMREECAAGHLVSPQKQRCGSDTNTPAREMPSSFEEAAYCSIPFPRIDSPYRSKGRWRSNSATYFLRDHKSAGSSPTPLPKRELSPNAPVFTPLTFAGKGTSVAASPQTESSLGPSSVWELPGLPSPLIESMQEPSMGLIPHPTPPVLAQSIFQRGHPQQCQQM